MRIDIKSKKFRWFVGIAVPIIVLGLAAFLYVYGNPVPCYFRRWTGINCPGCGSGRAAFDIVHFRFLEAMGHNIMFVILMPFAAYYLLKIYLFIVIGRDVLPFFNFSYRQMRVIFIIIVAFFILRNIPVKPFNLLSQ
ncbi:DUF2752 domain-containing protein [Vallitaleaceae bacterium 9-2]